MDADTARSLRRQLDTRPVGALGTLPRGEPAVSMVPFVLPAADTRLFIHVSTLAPHTRDRQEHPRVSPLLVAEPAADLSPQALPRVALQPVSARLVAGFGRACSLVGDALADWLRQGGAHSPSTARGCGARAG